MIRPSLHWHRWFGIIAGPWLLLVAASGIFLVFYQELDRAANPGFYSASAPPQGRVAAAITAAEQSVPGSMAGYVRMPAAPGETVVVNLVDRPGHAGAVGDAGREVFVDPGRGTVVGSRVWGEPGLSRALLMPMVYRLHFALLAGSTVEWLLGLVALAWLVDHAVALPLAMRSARRWRDALRLRWRARGHRRQFDLHRAGALWLLPVTAMLAFSGVAFNLNAEFRTVLGLFSRPADPPGADRPTLSRPLLTPPVDADAALATAAHHAPHARITGLRLDPARGLWLVDATDPRDPAPDYGGRSIDIDARSGTLVGDHHFAQGSAADTVLAWQYPLHSGRAFGWPGRLLVLAAGLVTLALVITGYRLWWTRLRARRSVSGRHARPLPGQPAPPAAMPAK
jgi:uncharacterized iron-regulated membrane protein